MRYDVLLADNDGTLMDFDRSERIALRSALAAHGIVLSEAMQRRYAQINQQLWEAFERKETTQEKLRVDRFRIFLKEIGGGVDAQSLSQSFLDELSQRADEIEGAYDFLREASARVPVIIVTNGISSVQRSRFARSRLTPFFSNVVISGEIGVAKPDPAFVAYALRLAGVSRERALLLGDSLTSDMAAAEAAGVDGCWFNPRGKSNGTACRPKYEVRSLKEVLTWL